MSYRVDVRDHGSTRWIPWSYTPDAEAALMEMRRTSLGFDSQVVDSQGVRLAAIIDGRRGAPWQR